MQVPVLVENNLLIIMNKYQLHSPSQILMNVLPTMEIVDRFASIMLEATSVLAVAVIH